MTCPTGRANGCSNSPASPYVAIVPDAAPCAEGSTRFDGLTVVDPDIYGISSRASRLAITGAAPRPAQARPPPAGAGLIPPEKANVGRSARTGVCVAAMTIPPALRWAEMQFSRRRTPAALSPFVGSSSSQSGARSAKSGPKSGAFSDRRTADGTARAREDRGRAPRAPAAPLPAAPSGATLSQRAPERQHLDRRKDRLHRVVVPHEMQPSTMARGILRDRRPVPLERSRQRRRQTGQHAQQARFAAAVGPISKIASPGCNAKERAWKMRRPPRRQARSLAARSDTGPRGSARLGAIMQAELTRTRAM
jgi:hypothetical protein